MSNVSSTINLILKKSVDKYFKTSKIKSVDISKKILPYKTYKMNRLCVLKFNSKYLQKNIILI